MRRGVWLDGRFVPFIAGAADGEGGEGASAGTGSTLTGGEGSQGSPDTQGQPAAKIAPAGGDSTAADWRAALPDTLKSDKSLASFKDIPALAQAFVETKKMTGGMLKIPGGDAKPEEIAAFREKLGVPKDASGYTAPQLDGLDEGRWNRWASQAHRLGLTPTQLEGLAVLEAEERQQAVALQQQGWVKALDEMKKEWGDATFNRRTTLAARAVERFGTPELKTFLDDTGMGDHPEMVKLFANLGELLAEDGYIAGDVAGVPGADEAKAKIDAIRADPKHPANNAEHPKHREAMAELENYYKIVYGMAEPATRR